MEPFVSEWVPVLFVSCTYTFLPVVSHYSTDLQVEVTGQDMQQCTNKDKEEEDCKLVNVHVNNTGLKVQI